MQLLTKHMFGLNSNGHMFFNNLLNKSQWLIKIGDSLIHYDNIS
jgi:hypothetical protein